MLKALALTGEKQTARELWRQMQLRTVASHGMLPLEFKPAYSVEDLLLQYLYALEKGALEKGGVQRMLADHFAKVYKVGMYFRQAV